MISFPNKSRASFINTNIWSELQFIIVGYHINQEHLLQTCEVYTMGIQLGKAVSSNKKIQAEFILTARL